MPKASEIDDIFAGKAPKPGKAEAPNATAGPSSERVAKVAASKGATEGVKKKKKKLKGPAAVERPEQAPAPAPSESAANGDSKPPKRPAETVLDPSIPQPAKKPKVTHDRPLAAAAALSKSNPKKRKAEVDEEERAFRDSRGREPRRKTEEGWNVYKEDELGISGAGGDTPLCPFDCDCCF